MRGLNAAEAAELTRTLLREGESMTAVWRHGVLQLLDDYLGDVRHGRTDEARRRFSDEPRPTGSARVDAALASLAEHVSRRDGWDTPAWAMRPSRYTKDWWFVTPFTGMHATALQQSPLSFRKRGVFITAEALSRA